jgi:hypothetical protein
MATRYLAMNEHELFAAELDANLSSHISGL